MIAIKAKSRPGSMGDLITRRDWSNTPVGPNSQWPQHLRTTLNVMLDSRFPMFLFWGTEMLCFYNDSYRPYLGNQGKHPSILGMPAREGSPESWPVIGPYLEKVMKSGEAYSMEDFAVPLNRNGKTDEWFGTLSFSPVFDENGKPAGVLTICFETTNREAVLKETREREDQLNFIMEAAELGAWDYNPRTGMFMANRRLKEWFGFPEMENVDLQRAIDIIIPEDQEKVRNSVLNSVTRRNGGKHDISYTIVHPQTGVRRILRAKGKAFFNDSDEVAYRFNGTLQDITNEVLAQNAMKINEEKFRELMDSSPIAMCLLRSDDYRIISINENMLALLGRSFEEVNNVSLFESMPRESLTGLQTVLDKVTSTGEIFRAYGHPFKLPRGSRMIETFVDFAYQPIFDSAGKVISIIAAATDVTDQVLLQRRLDRKKEEIKKQMLKSSIDAQEKERELISNELHDNVNQLLACTKLFLEMIEPDEASTKVCVGRGSAFIEQAMEEIRDISHALNPGILNFVGLFKSIREMLEKLNRTHPIIFSFDSSRCRKEWKPNADIELTIFRIVQTQVTNIIRHSSAVSADVVLSSGADYMELVISDDGKGFDTRKTRRGLGLLNVVNRTELLNGSVSLQSAPNKGCKLKVRIPARGRRAVHPVSSH